MREVEGGATSKIGEARFGKCRLTITPPEFIKGVRERRIFRRKKNGGRGPVAANGFNQEVAGICPQICWACWVFFENFLVKADIRQYSILAATDPLDPLLIDTINDNKF